MSNTSLRTCLRCHAKKIKCTGFPACQGCSSAGIQCEPYQRTKKSETLESLRQARGRVRWLEDQVYQKWGIECRDIPTGTSLQSVIQPQDGQETSLQSAARQNLSPSSRGTSIEFPAPAIDAPEISLVALNATGDARYLGPSSGAFFAVYAMSIARSLTSNEGSWRHPFIHETNDQDGRDEASSLTDQREPLSATDVQLLLRSYEMWVHPLFLLIRPETLRRLVERCSSFQETGNVDHDPKAEKNTEMAIFYLVMALGAINQANTVKQMRTHFEPHNLYSLPGKKHSHAHLYLRALHHFDCTVQHLKPSIATIQIVLLISIYGSYGPIGSSQWQLAGLAMRMATELGLHYAPKVCHVTEQEMDERSCVFWTAYAIEMSLAYNLGRPPSIGEEHITTVLPINSEALQAVHYVKHRQIQSKIISQIYCGNNSAEQMSINQKAILISGLQAQLDEWRANIPTQTEEASAYPHSYWDRLYHGTSFVLHRSSPLCPNPLPQSLEKCVRSAGAYIDDMMTVLRNSNVPLSWMQVQGVLFAGLTMLITIRKGFQQLASQAGWPFLLVEFPAWTRNCSICLAIMNERWKKDLLSKVEAQFETLANDTLRIFSSWFPSQLLGFQDYSTSNQSQLAAALPSSTPFESNEFFDQTVESGFSMGGDWEPIDMFRDVLGLETVQTFWNISSAEPHDDSRHA